MMFMFASPRREMFRQPRRWRSMAAWLVGFWLCSISLAAAEETLWTIPIAGNAYVTSGEMPQGRRGLSRWDRADVVRSIYFRVDRPADLQVALRGSVPEGKS